MAIEQSRDEVFRFDAPGTLQAPNAIGRLVRLAVGAYLLWNVYLFVTLVGHGHVTNGTVIIWFAVTVWLVPYVVNIGWGVRWGMWPRIALLGLWAATIALSWTLSGDLPGPLGWLVVKWTTLYVIGHLGLSFVLSAIIATPGCEMRAIPDLAGRMSGRARQEHYCPGFIDRVDRWERSIRGRNGSNNTP